MADDKNSRDAAAEDLEEAHPHADPAKGDQSGDGGRANVTPVDQGCGVAEADKKL